MAVPGVVATAAHGRMIFGHTVLNPGRQGVQMTAKMVVLAAILSIGLLAASGKTFASSGNPVMYLAWQPATEVLEYHSCGAGDACWVAHVKSRKTKQRIAMLRCDGEKLFSGVAGQPEAMVAGDCHQFERENKFQRIPAALRALLQR